MVFIQKARVLLAVLCLGIISVPVGSAAELVAPPSGLRAWLVDFESQYIFLKWDAPATPPALYRVYSAGELVATTEKTSFLDMEYDRDLPHLYWVTAVDSQGNESEPSNMVRDPRLDE